MKTCCQDIPEINCAAVSINERIAPITFEEDTIVIDAPLETGAPFSVSGAEINVEAGHIEIPAKTLLNGVPLISDAFVGDAIPIPSNTTINGYKPTIEQYFYFFSTTSSTFLIDTFNGYIINGRDFTTSTPVIDLRGFPFIAPEDCVLTSLRLSYILTPGLIGVPGDGRISLDVIDTNLNPFFTGVSYDIIAPGANSNTSFYKQFEYMLRKGDSVGLYVSGTSQFNGGILVFATLGYRILPPLTLTTIVSLRQSTTLKASNYNYNRFPFNNIMNSIKNNPVQFEEQLENKNSQYFYGRKLTLEDYYNRAPSTTDAFKVLVQCINFTPESVAHQDAVAFLLSGQKKNRWYVNMTTHNQNTHALVEQHDWKGISYQENDENDYINMLQIQDAPSNIDYLSFELDVRAFESFIPVFSFYTFNFATIRHNGNAYAQSTIGNMMQFIGYERIFVSVMIGDETKEDWYIGPNVLDHSVIEAIQNHPQSRDCAPWNECVTVLSCLL